MLLELFGIGNLINKSIGGFQKDLKIKKYVIDPIANFTVRTAIYAMQRKESKIKKTPLLIPFDFVLEQLERLEPRVNPMFGCHAVYAGEKILLILRKKPGDRYDNGVWLATTSEHHESLKKEFPSMRSIRVFGGGETGWQVLPSDADDFEESVMRACALILKQDVRIGKIPKKKKKKQ